MRKSFVIERTLRASSPIDTVPSRKTKVGEQIAMPADEVALEALRRIVSGICRHVVWFALATRG